MSAKQKKGIKYNNVILVPTDFSEICENAIKHGAELAQFLKYKVCVLHVITPPSGAKTKKIIPSSDVAMQKLQHYKNSYEKKYSVVIEPLIKEGNILEIINKVASEVKASLMVLGTPGKQGLQHLFGSYALKVVLDSPCPVVVVQKRTFGKGYRNIVLPVSLDNEPRQTVEWVIRMHRIFKSKVHIFQARETDPGLKSQLKIITMQISAVFDEKKIPFKVKIAEKSSNYSAQAISYAVANNTDLIMILTMPSLDVPGFNFSKWDERMMFNVAQIPVMCINPVELGSSYYDWMMLT
jgi:nucleotide-binding universal stress UspA family protein